MGQHTSYVGRVDIRPALSADEIEFLKAFTHSRHDRGRDALDVAQHPADDEVPPDHAAVREAALPAPGVWCPWTCCPDGCCLHWDGVEKPYAPDAWLRHLIDVLLRPGAALTDDPHARRLGLTFDHVLDGLLVGQRQETSELFAIEVEANVVRRRVLLPARDGVDEYGCRAEVDERRERRQARAERRRRFARAIEEDRLREQG